MNKTIIIILIILIIGIISFILINENYLSLKSINSGKNRISGVSLSQYLLSKWGAIDCSGGKCTVAKPVTVSGDVEATDFVIKLVCADGLPSETPSSYTQTCTNKCPSGVFVNNVCYGFNDTTEPTETPNTQQCVNATYTTSTTLADKVCYMLCPTHEYTSTPNDCLVPSISVEYLTDSLRLLASNNYGMGALYNGNIYYPPIDDNILTIFNTTTNVTTDITLPVGAPPQDFYAIVYDRFVSSNGKIFWSNYTGVHMFDTSNNTVTWDAVPSHCYIAGEYGGHVYFYANGNSINKVNILTNVLTSFTLSQSFYWDPQNYFYIYGTAHGVMGGGKIYQYKSDSTGLLIFDMSNDTYYIETTEIGISWKYGRGYYASDGKIYYPEINNTTKEYYGYVGVFDTNTNTWSEFWDENWSANNRAMLMYNMGAVEIDGKIYFGPGNDYLGGARKNSNRATNLSRALVINLADDSLSQITIPCDYLVTTVIHESSGRVMFVPQEGPVVLLNPVDNSLLVSENIPYTSTKPVYYNGSVYLGPGGIELIDSYDFTPAPNIIKITPTGI